MKEITELLEERKGFILSYLQNQVSLDISDGQKNVAWCLQNNIKWVEALKDICTIEALLNVSQPEEIVKIRKCLLVEMIDKLQVENQGASNTYRDLCDKEGYERINERIMKLSFIRQSIIQEE